MKKFHALSLFLFLIGLGNVSAQKTIEEGTFKMEITKIDSDNPMLAMMQGSKVALSFDESNSLLEMDMMNGMMKMTTHTDKTSKKTTILMDMMGSKMMAEDNGDLAEDQKPEIEVTYDKTDTKKILDYNCYRANIKIKNGGKTMDMTAYVTKDVKASANLLKQQGVDMSQLDGFPLEYAVNADQKGMKLTMTFEVVEIISSLKENAFELKTEGYKKVSMDELGKGAGMGF